MFNIISSKMEESRLLHFEVVYIYESTDDVLLIPQRGGWEWMLGR